MLSNRADEFKPQLGKFPALPRPAVKGAKRVPSRAALPPYSASARHPPRLNADEDIWAAAPSVQLFPLSHLASILWPLEPYDRLCQSHQLICSVVSEGEKYTCQPLLPIRAHHIPTKVHSFLIEIHPYKCCCAVFPNEIN